MSDIGPPVASSVAVGCKTSSGMVPGACSIVKLLRALLFGYKIEKLCTWQWQQAQAMQP